VNFFADNTDYRRATAHRPTTTGKKAERVLGCTCGEEIPLSDRDAVNEHIATCNGWPKEDDDEPSH